MKVRALKKRAGLRMHRAIHQRAFDRACRALGDGISEELTAIRAQWDVALRQIARALIAPIAASVEFRSMVRDIAYGGATTPGFAARYRKPFD